MTKALTKSLAILLIFASTASLGQEKSLNLMPVPAEIQVGDGHFLIQKDFSISLRGKYDSRLQKEATRFLRRLDLETGKFFTQHQVTGAKESATFFITVQRSGKVKLHENESYQLTVGSSRIELQATTDIGAIRGLETLLQLVEVKNGAYYFPEVTIADEPRFEWRGLMLDVARHYMPLDVLYRNMDAMAAVKLNVLHLHLSDDQGFRFPSKAFPKLTELGSDGKFYTLQELEKIIAYADQRGIRVMPEIDVPGHATSILTAYPELGSKDTTYTLERYAGIFDPTLDPTNDEVYTFLKTLFSEVAAVFPDQFFHLGGDENMGKHWDANQDIQAFMKARSLQSNHDLQTYFNIKLEKILEGLGKRTMGWEEIMSPDMPKTAVIHSWRGENEGTKAKKSLYQAARSGYETILSNGYYLDLMHPTSSHYLVDPAPENADLTEEERKNILGGEACMWSELAIPATIDSRLWPRAAAIAERLWSPERINDVDDMYRRIEIMSLHLEKLGLKHVTTPNKILRSLAKSRDIAPLKTLAQVSEPMKGYTRNPGGTMYASYSPFMLWADAVTPDARVARVFNQHVEKYLNGEDTEKQLVEKLQLWQQNHALVLPIIERSPVLTEIKDLSANLSAVAKIGLEAVEYIKKNETPENSWFAAASEQLKAATENGGRTELQVINGMKLLVGHLEAKVK